MSCCLLETSTLRKIATFLFVLSPTKRGGFHRDIRSTFSVRNRERPRMSGINLVESHDFIASRFSITPACRRRTDMKKDKDFPYSIPSVGPGADPGVQAVSPQVTVSHPPGGRLPLLSARHAVTFPTAEHPALWPVPSYTAW